MSLHAQAVLETHEDLIVDLFAGGGGASAGIEEGLGRMVDIAINHDAAAVGMHAANHPQTKHHVSDVFEIDPRIATGGRPISLLWASPDCTYHSKARGGKPIRHKNQKRRALAWVVTRWAGQVKPAVIMLENVEEFADWGGLHAKRDKETGRVIRTIPRSEPREGADGIPEDKELAGDCEDAGILIQFRSLVARPHEVTAIEDQCLVPNPKKRSHSFKNWVRSLERHGYVVEWRELRACDYGAPTIRKRLFVIARRDGLPIVWPEATHAAPCKECEGTGKVKRKVCPACKGSCGTGGLLPFRTAAECIDWTIPIPSIFLNPAEAKAWGDFHGQDSPKRPLADNTMKRIARGVQRYVLDNPKPFLVSVANSKTTGRAPNVWPEDEPLRTVTSTNPFGVVSPIIAGVGGRAGQSPERSADSPMATVTAKADAAIVAPIIAPITHGNPERRTPPATEPLATITCAQRGEQALIAPVMVKNNHGDKPHSSVEEPLKTIVAGGTHHTVVAPCLVPRYGEREGQEPRTRSIEEPAATVVNTGNGDGLVAASLISYHDEQGGNARAKGLPAPLETIDTSNRHAVVAGFIAQQNGGYYDARGGTGRPLEKPNGAVCAEGSPQSLVAVHCVTNNNSRAPHYGADEPAHTKVADGAGHNIVAASLTKFRTGATGQELTEPMPTVTSNSHNTAESHPGGAAPIGLMAAHIQRDFGTSTGHEADRPLGTITGDGGGKAGLVASFMSSFYGQGIGQEVKDPARTIPTVDRFALVTVEINGQVYVIEDIGMRMLQPVELYLAQGFRKGYIIDVGANGRKLNKSEMVRMCGNSVPPPFSRALTRANLPHLIVQKRAA